MTILQSRPLATLNLNTRKISIDKNIEYYDVDTNIATIFLQIYQADGDGVITYLDSEELSNYTAKLFLIKPITHDFKEITGVATTEITTENGGGVLKFVLPKNCTNRYGVVKCEIHIIKGDELLASNRFIYSVYQSLVTKFNNSLLEDSDFPVLQQLINNVQKVNNIDDTDASAITTYSGNKIENIKSELGSQIKNIENNTLNASSFGITTDKSVDNYNSLHSLFKEVGRTITYDDSISSNGFFTKTVNIPNGLYRVKQADLFKDCFSTRSQNLVINGNGATIILENFEGSLFENNDKALNIDIYNLNFVSINDDKAINRKFISSESNGGAQAIRFHQCNFSGKLKYGIDLTGSNCNSEWVFNQCGFYGSWESFLYIGSTNTSDQFINYWFNNCKYWSSSNWITAYRGGHFKLNHCDVSGYQPSEDTYLFKLLGGSHSSGITSFIDDGTRYEIKSSQSKVIYCEWDKARVSFENSDFSSNSFNVVERNDVFSFKNASNGIGSSYVFTNCNLLGKFKLNTSNIAYACELTLNNCYLDGGAGVSKIQDIFNITCSTNVGAVFRVYLNHTKCLGDTYSMVLGGHIGEFNILNTKATLKQSPYSNLTPDWEILISQPTIVDEVIYFTKGYQQDGHTYKFSVKSDTSCVVEQTNLYNSKKNVKCSNVSRLYIGNKITIGESNTVYEITGIDMGGSYVVLDKEVEEGVLVGNKIEFNILDISQRPNTDMKMLKSDNKYIVTNNLYIKNTGEVAIRETGLQSAIVVKTLE